MEICQIKLLRKQENENFVSEKLHGLKENLQGDRTCNGYHYVGRKKPRTTKINVQFANMP